MHNRSVIHLKMYRGEYSAISLLKSIIIGKRISTQYEGMKACKKNSWVIPELARLSKLVFKPRGNVNYELNVSHF